VNDNTAKNTAKALVLPVALLLAFEVWARAAHLQSDSLAPPSQIILALAEAFADFSILIATRDTLFAAFAGLAIGSIIGLALGIAFGLSNTFDRLMEVTVEAIRPIPSIALLPIALIALSVASFALCVWLMKTDRSATAFFMSPPRAWEFLIGGIVAVVFVLLVFMLGKRSGKKKTTMAKLMRESKLRERRLDKQARKDARKLASANGTDQLDETLGVTPDEPAEPADSQPPLAGAAQALTDA